MTIPAAALISLATAVPASPAPAACDPARVRLTASAPPQGGVDELEVDAESEPAATWRGKPLRFWREDAKGPWRALVGIDLAQRPGAARVLLKEGAGKTCAAVLSVTAVAFPEEHLTLAPKYVDLSAEDAARAARETARLEAVFRAVSPERLWQGPFRIPIEGVQPSSSFGRRRVLNGQPRSPHSGVDLGSPTGTPVAAMQRGRVVLDEDLFFSGHTIVLDHGLGLFSFYGHLSESKVKAGQVVDAGEVIGLVGATGRVTAPHLHWAVRIGDARVDGLDLVKLTSPPTPAPSGRGE